jgi:hypothetical protein
MGKLSGKKNAGDSGDGELDGKAAAALVAFTMQSLQDEETGIRVEDALGFLSTIVAERCIDAAGDYDLRDHDLTPGSRTFSDKINAMLAGEVAEDDIARIPAQSVFGMLRDQLQGTYDLADFPKLSAVFRHFAENIGGQEDWGKVPLSVPAKHHPGILPLQVGYETRDTIDQLFESVASDKPRIVRVCVAALSDLLGKVRGAIDPKVALALTFELVNGMAKTAPMTTRAMQQAQDAD